MKKFVLTAMLATLSAASAAGTLVFGANGEPVSLESGNITDGISILVQRQIYDTLIDFKDGTTDLTPGLATSWKPNANNTSWTFTLRRGVKFTDGTPMNADAIVFNLQRWWDKAHPFGFRDQGRTFEIVGELLGGYKGDATAVIKDIVKVNDTTVRVDLNKPSSVLPNVLAAGYFGIASPAAIRKDGAKYGTPASTPVGTGPFVFDSWQPDTLKVKKNPDYWQKGLPHLETVTLRSDPEDGARIALLRSGEAQLITPIPPQQAAVIEHDPKLALINDPSIVVRYIAMNVMKKPFNDPRVRQALNHAVDK